MQRFARLTMSVFLLCCVAPGVAGAQEMRDLYTTRDSSGREKVYRVPENKLVATKRWTPETEAPPLSVPAAVAVARKRLNAKQPDSLRAIKIELIASGGQEWRWFYRIELYDVASARGGQPPEVLEVLVLMDGSVVEPASARRPE